MTDTAYQPHGYFLFRTDGQNVPLHRLPSGFVEHKIIRDSADCTAEQQLIDYVDNLQARAKQLREAKGTLEAKLPPNLLVVDLSDAKRLSVMRSHPSILSFLSTFRHLNTTVVIATTSLPPLLVRVEEFCSVFMFGKLAIGDVTRAYDMCYPTETLAVFTELHTTATATPDAVLTVNRTSWPPRCFVDAIDAAENKSQ